MIIGALGKKGYDKYKEHKAKKEGEGHVPTQDGYGPGQSGGYGPGQTGGYAPQQTSGYGPGQTGGYAPPGYAPQQTDGQGPGQTAATQAASASYNAGQGAQVDPYAEPERRSG